MVLDCRAVAAMLTGAAERLEENADRLSEID